MLSMLLLAIHTYNHTREDFGVQYFAQGHFDMQPEQTTDFLTSGQATLPPEPQ